MHCKAHQLRNTPVNNGNCLADKTAKEAAGMDLSLILPHKYQCLHNEVPRYQTEDEKLGRLLGAKKNNEGWWVIPNRQVIIPQPLTRKIAEEKDQATHWGTESMTEALKLHVLSV